MKFIGISKGEFKILDDLDPDQLEGLDTDFAWIDIDRIEPKIQLLMKRVYGISEVGTFGFPNIISGDNYDLIRINYYEEQTKKELEIYVLGKYLITVHSGDDPVSEEAMASVNEMLVSGKFDTGAVLSNIFANVVERHEAYLKDMQESLRSLNLTLKEGISNVAYLSQLQHDSRELHRVFYDTRSQIADILVKATPIRGLDNTEDFIPIYSKINDLANWVDDFSDMVDDYTSQLIPSMWDQMGKIRGIAVGISALSASIAAAALFYMFFPQGVFGIEAVYIVLAMVTLGVLGLITAQRRIKFKA